MTLVCEFASKWESNKEYAQSIFTKYGKYGIGHLWADRAEILGGSPGHPHENFGGVRPAPGVKNGFGVRRDLGRAIALSTRLVLLIPKLYLNRFYDPWGPRYVIGVIMAKLGMVNSMGIDRSDLKSLSNI